MTKFNPKNERIKREYFRYLHEADGKSPATVEGIRKSILRFEQYNQLKDFSTFNHEQAIGFKKRMTENKNERTGKPIGLSTLCTTMSNLKDFFKWLCQKPGFKSKIRMSDASYFNLTDKENRAAKAKTLQKYPTLEQICKVVKAMPEHDDIAKRNRALVAFTILTGIRVQAIASLKIKHVDLEQKLVTQDPREVKTKFSKIIHTFFYPVGDDIQQIVTDWVKYLISEKLFGYDAPLFPKTILMQDENLAFKPAGITPEHWTTASPIREIFKAAFQAVGLPYYKPHSFRHTLVHLMNRYCKDMEQVHAWSQNLGHDSPITTYTSYGHMEPQRQGEVIKSLIKTDVGA